MDFVTGATGLLGSFIAEQLVRRGRRVRALVRRTSDTSFLEALGVELIEGDLADAQALQNAVAGAKVVYHAAAKVGDWGKWKEFRRDNIGGTQNILHACTANHVDRLLYVSSVSVYGRPRARTPISEDHPLGLTYWLWDDYTLAKVEAEKRVWEHHRRFGLPVSIIRPSWIYGPRDRTSLDRLATSLRLGRTKILGSGDNRLNLVYAGNVADACILAAESPNSIGEAYNLSDDGPITQQEYMNLLADAFEYPRPRIHVPVTLAFYAGFMLEAIRRTLGAPHPPWLTRHAVWLLGRRTFFSSRKAREQLGWSPRVPYKEGVRLAAEWHQRQAGLQAEGTEKARLRWA